MFGYVVINKSELKFKEFDIYRGYYCGLCRSLRERHGLTGQLTLTYDMTFLALLLSSLYEPDITDEMHRCIVHPTKKQRMIRTRYTDYVADMNVILSYYKARDDWKDDRSVLKLAFSKLLKKSNNVYKEKSEAIASLLDELGTREQENETNIDVMAGIFGRIMSVLFVPEKDQWAPVLERMGFFLGKFIYILDAYDDLENDIKKNRYNPFKDEYYQTNTSDNKHSLKNNQNLSCHNSAFDDKIKNMLTMMMAECSKEFEMLPIIENAEILRNILYAGVWTTYYNHIKSRTSDSSQK